MRQPIEEIFRTDPWDFIRLPGLLRRWEIEQVLEHGAEFHIEEAGETADGTLLFAVYRRDSDRSGRPQTHQ